MGSTGEALAKRLPELVGQIMDEHAAECACRYDDGARERMRSRALVHAAMLGDDLEREERPLDPADPYGKQER
jgi:hypothetical protein